MYRHEPYPLGWEVEFPVGEAVLRGSGSPRCLRVTAVSVGIVCILVPTAFTDSYAIGLC